jgi:hypothetical protein
MSKRSKATLQNINSSRRKAKGPLSSGPASEAQGGKIQGIVEGPAILPAGVLQEETQNNQVG